MLHHRPPPASLLARSYANPSRIPRYRSRISCAINPPSASLSTRRTFLSKSRKSHLWHRNFTQESHVAINPIFPGESQLSVVLLGWLGSEQRHLRKYAEWYNSRGIHAITFSMPMNELLSLNAISNADRHVDSLYMEITNWLMQHEDGVNHKNVIFHTFSNTGWFFYGAILEKLLLQEHFVNRIKGCIVDSGPAAELSPQVWASGFATALLKKQSFSTKSVAGLTEAELAVLVQPSVQETLLLSLLERFFSVLLSIPVVRRRLLRAIETLSTKQPPCPQLYLYSTADRVIPYKYVEDFMALQKKLGYKVSSCNLQLSPHVDHFRNFPVIYCGQIEKFIRECFHASRETEKIY